MIFNIPLPWNVLGQKHHLLFVSLAQEVHAEVNSPVFWLNTGFLDSCMVHLTVEKICCHNNTKFYSRARLAASLKQFGLNELNGLRMLLFIQVLQFDLLKATM